MVFLCTPKLSTVHKKESVAKLSSTCSWKREDVEGRRRHREQGEGKKERNEKEEEGRC